VKVEGLKVDWLFKKEGWEFLNSLYNNGSDELFRSRAIIVITEFLFINVRPMILKWQLSVYICQMGLFFLSIYSKEIFSEGMELIYLDYVNLGISIWKAWIMIKMVFVDEGIRTFKKLWSWFDLTYFSVLGFLSISAIHRDRMRHQEGGELESTFEFTRYLEALLSITIWGKLMFYLQLIDELAPLIKIIILIFRDIRWFMIVFIVMIFAFANAFYLVGQNQIVSG
jgi:hypothetical protein